MARVGKESNMYVILYLYQYGYNTNIGIRVPKEGMWSSRNTDVSVSIRIQYEYQDTYAQGGDVEFPTTMVSSSSIVERNKPTNRLIHFFKEKQTLL